MADGLIRYQVSVVRNQGVVTAAPRLLIAVSCLLSSVFCYAEELPDPTRPPALIFSPGGASGPGAAENRWSSGLQTIIISESRRAAIIDGQTVELGAKHGNARLVEVNEGSVTLQSARSRQVLTLFPDVKISRRTAQNKEQTAMPPSSARTVQSDEHQAMPAAREEKK